MPSSSSSSRAIKLRSRIQALQVKDSREDIFSREAIRVRVRVRHLHHSSITRQLHHHLSQWLGRITRNPRHLRMVGDQAQFMGLNKQDPILHPRLLSPSSLLLY